MEVLDVNASMWRKFMNTILCDGKVDQRSQRNPRHFHCRLGTKVLAEDNFAYRQESPNDECEDLRILRLGAVYGKNH